MVKILLLSANPQGIPLHKIAEEVREIKNELHKADFGDQFVLEQEGAVRLRDLTEILRRSNPDIVHFSGHTSQSAEIVLLDDGGFGKPISPEAMKGIFGQFKGNIRCIVLSSCYGEALANALAEDIDCVVGMIGELPDESAPDFARELYRQLAGGLDVASAFKAARLHLEQYGKLTRMLAYKANPSEIVFVKLPLNTKVLITEYILRIILPIFVIYFFSIVIVNLFTRDDLALLYSSVFLSSSLGVIWGTLGAKYLLEPFVKQLWK